VVVMLMAGMVLSLFAVASIAVNLGDWLPDVSEKYAVLWLAIISFTCLIVGGIVGGWADARIFKK
jgi:putative Ca2+/H+ antiporter (TMEM165/GDT1 family)